MSAKPYTYSRCEACGERNVHVHNGRLAVHSGNHETGAPCIGSGLPANERRTRPARPSVCLSCGHAEAYGSTAGGCPCTAEEKQRAVRALARTAFPEWMKP